MKIAINFNLALSLTLSVATTITGAGAQSSTRTSTQSSTIIRHFVAFKFKEGVSAEQEKKIDDAFLDLKKKIPFIISITHGNNCSPEKLNKGFTDGFTVTFKNSKDRDTYLTHEAHEKFKALALPSVSEAFVFDYADGQNCDDIGSRK